MNAGAEGASRRPVAPVPGPAVAPVPGPAVAPVPGPAVAQVLGPAVVGPGDGTRAVALGGGHGVARTLAALPAVVDHVTAIVTVADDGGSSGRLRRDLDVLPPGDLRMALTTMSPHRELAEIIGYRFGRGELSGHSLGNLVLVALQDLSDGDVVTALDRLAVLLAVPGRVLPCTTQAITLLAATADGGVTGQVAVAATPRLERVWLEPADAPGTPAAVAAIERADLIVLGPGSIYTSLLPNLLVRDIGDAVIDARAPVVFVANLREQPGETEGMTLVDHLDAICAHVPELHIDVVIAHEGSRPTGDGEPLLPDREALAQRAGQVISADLLDGADGHAPAALGRIFDRLLRA